MIVHLSISRAITFSLPRSVENVACKQSFMDRTRLLWLPASFMSYAHFIIRNSTVVIERNRNNGLDPSVQSVRTHQKKIFLSVPLWRSCEKKKRAREWNSSPLGQPEKKECFIARPSWSIFFSLWPSLAQHNKRYICTSSNPEEEGEGKWRGFLWERGAPKTQVEL